MDNCEEKLIAVLMAVIHGLERQVAELTTVDSLTGALTRRQVEPLLLEAAERNARTEEPVSLLVLEVDGFGAIDESYGHATADAVLRDVAHVIRGRVRKLDKLFRLAGGAFLLVLPGANGDQATRVAAELRALVSQARALPMPGVTVSVGVAELSAGEPIDAWIWEAEAALLEARDRGVPVIARRATPFDGPELIEEHASGTWRRAPGIAAGGPARLFALPPAPLSACRP